jgi:transposase
VFNRAWVPDQKINLLRRHHLDKVPVSEVWEGAELHPSAFYGWQRHLFDHGAAAFGESRKRVETSREQELLAVNYPNPTARSSATTAPSTRAPSTL